LDTHRWTQLDKIEKTRDPVRARSRADGQDGGAGRIGADAPGRRRPAGRVAAEATEALLSPDVHRILTVERRWPAELYERW
jgi:hypothetical protein